MIYTDPVLRYLVSVDGSAPPLVESVAWAYAPDHPFAVPLPDELFAMYSTHMYSQMDAINADLKAEFDADMAAWLLLPKKKRPDQPTLRYADKPINKWVLMDGNWLVDGDVNVSHDIYNMRAISGYKFVDVDEYNAALAEWNQRQEDIQAALSAESLAYRQKEWDIKSTVYRKVGLDEADIETVIGPRPKDDL